MHRGVATHIAFQAESPYSNNRPNVLLNMFQGDFCSLHRLLFWTSLCLPSTPRTELHACQSIIQLLFHSCETTLHSSHVRWLSNTQKIWTTTPRTYLTLTNWATFSGHIRDIPRNAMGQAPIGNMFWPYFTRNTNGETKCHKRRAKIRSCKQKADDIVTACCIP